jgi:glucuronokinase
MQLIRQRACARVGLVGNPSDGYNGRTISVALENFQAETILYEWDRVEILLSQEDQSRFDSVHDLVDDVRLHGYYGGVRLVKATIKSFVEYCRAREMPLHDRNFAVRYTSNIPRAVGLAGSSAIIVATLRALMEFYEVTVPDVVQPSLVLSIETGELGITAGLQDRVIQVYGGMVEMDFSRERIQQVDGYECGRYENLDVSLLPRLYVAYSTDAGQPTEMFHDRLRERYDAGDPEVVTAMTRFAQLARESSEALVAGDRERLHGLIDANYDTRASICRLPSRHVAMVEAARSVGVCAKFAGSGGAIVGTCADDETFDRLEQALAPLDCRVLTPRIAPPQPGG